MGKYYLVRDFQYVLLSIEQVLKTLYPSLNIKAFSANNGKYEKINNEIYFIFDCNTKYNYVTVWENIKLYYPNIIFIDDMRFISLREVIDKLSRKIRNDEALNILVKVFHDYFKNHCLMKGKAGYLLLCTEIEIFDIIWSYYGGRDLIYIEENVRALKNEIELFFNGQQNRNQIIRLTNHIYQKILNFERERK